MFNIKLLSSSILYTTFAMLALLGLNLGLLQGSETKCSTEFLAQHLNKNATNTRI